MMQIGSHFYSKFLCKMGLDVRLDVHLDVHFCATWVCILTHGGGCSKMEICAIVFVFTIKGMAKDIENYIFYLRRIKVLKRLSFVQ